MTDTLSDLINDHTELGIPVILNLDVPVTIGSYPAPDDHPVNNHVESHVAVLLRNRGIVGQPVEIRKILTRDHGRVAFVVVRKGAS